MKAKMKIGILVGSLRKESFSRKLAMSLMKIAPTDLIFEIVEINRLSLYDEDMDENPPVEWVEFRNQLKKFDGFLFVTPEYNRSIPGGLKNALDIGSRPYGLNVFYGKPAGIVSVSIGKMGGFGVNHHLRQALVFLNVPTMQQPEAYIGEAEQLFGSAGQLISETTKEFLIKYLQAFETWVERNLFLSNYEANSHTDSNIVRFGSPQLGNNWQLSEDQNDKDPILQ